MALTVWSELPLDQGSATVDHMAGFGFRVLGTLLGEGQFGEVFAAEMTRGGHPVPLACKVAPRINTNPRELLVSRRMSHPNIVRVFAIFMPHPDDGPNGRVYTFMERMETDLDHYVKGKVEGHLEEAEAKFLFKQVAAGVEYIHSLGYSHSDLNTWNVLLNHVGNNIASRPAIRAKLADFGAVKEVEIRPMLGDKETSFKKKLDPGEKYYIWQHDPRIDDIKCLVGMVQFMLSPLGDFDELPQTAQDFCNDILISQRRTIAEVLNHVWMNPRKVRQVAEWPDTRGAAGLPTRDFGHRRASSPLETIEPIQAEPLLEEAMINRLVPQDPHSVTSSPSGRDHTENYQHWCGRYSCQDPDHQEL